MRRDVSRFPASTVRHWQDLPKTAAQARRHRRPQPLPPRLSAPTWEPIQRTAHEPVVVQRRDPEPAAAARGSRRRRRDGRRGTHPVPPALRQYAELDHHVVLVGQGSKFELWDETKWQEATARTITFPRAVCRRSWTASAFDGRRRPCSRPARGSHRRPGDSPRRHLRRRDASAAADTLARSSESSRRAGRLFAFDRDPAAAAARAPSTIHAFVFGACWFSELTQVLATRGVERVDGALLDLGISSPQIDDPARGFSFRADGPLDMRMDPTRGESAAAFLARATTRELAEVIRDYGEERFAQSIAGAIVAARAGAPVVATRQLAAIVAKAVGARPRVIGVRIRPRARSRLSGFSSIASFRSSR